MTIEITNTDLGPMDPKVNGTFEMRINGKKEVDFPLAIAFFPSKKMELVLTKNPENEIVNELIIYINGKGVKIIEPGDTLIFEFKLDKP